MGDLTTVDGLKAELLRAFEEADAVRAASLYEPGARLLPPGAGVITGEDAVREFFATRFAAGSDGGELPPGATLVLFTDGLVESRSTDIDAGLARLQAAAARTATTDPDELCDRLLAELTGEHRADDIALLVLTRLP